MKKVKKPAKINRRNQTKYPALKPELNLKTRKEEISDLHSYMHKLNEKEKAWLNKFAEEYINASFGPKPLHKTKALRKACYDSNNARNRDILTIAKATGKINSYDYSVLSEKIDDENEGED